MDAQLGLYVFTIPSGTYEAHQIIRITRPSPEGSDNLTKRVRLRSLLLIFTRPPHNLADHIFDVFRDLIVHVGHRYPSKVLSGSSAILVGMCLT
jgi:hypothetical protein